MVQALKSLNITQYKSGQWETISGGLIVETPVSLTVNGEVWLTFMCTPVDLEALAVGFLFNENVLKSKDELASVRVCANGENIDVWLNFSVENPKSWRRTSGCTGGLTTTEPESETPPEGPPPERMFTANGLRLTPEGITTLVGELFEAQQLYREVGGVHTSALSDGHQILLAAEDIGRHNTLDKIAGRCLLEGINPEQCVLLTTGRISSEMMQKSARIGAQVVISRTAASSLSTELAQRWGITLVGYARRDRFMVYAHPERIEKITPPMVEKQPDSK